MKENTIRQHEQTKHQNKHWDVHIQQKLQKVEELKTKKEKEINSLVSQQTKTKSQSKAAVTDLLWWKK